MRNRRILRKITVVGIAFVIIITGLSLTSDMIGRTWSMNLSATTTSTNEGDIVINEVQYDPSESGVDAAYEWMELMNRTSQPINLTDWQITDNVSTDTIPSLTIPSGGFAIVAASTSFYANFPSFTGDIVFIVDGNIGNGLSNTGDRLVLTDSTGEIIDALSYGSDTTILSPSCQDVSEGHSLERQPAGLDTNQAGDFVDNSSPTPGYGLSGGTIPTSSPTPSATPSPTTTPTPIFTPLPTQTPIATLQVHYIDVGQGDSILLDLGTTEVLIDGGERTPGVVSYMQQYVDGSLEAMIATHPDADHIGGLIAVLDAFDVEQIWTNGQTVDTTTYTDFMSRVNAEGANVQVARRGDTITAGGLVFKVLNPVDPLFSGTNENSIVLALKYGEENFLFTGDAGYQAEASMISASVLQEAQVLKVGHHGSSSATSQAFLDVVHPEVAIYMAGVGNTYGHPSPVTISALQAIGAQIYGTDTCGTITVTTDGNSYTVSTAQVCTTPTPTSTPIPTPTSTQTPTPTPTTSVTGITREVNGNILSGVTITLDGNSTVVSDQNGQLQIIVTTTGSHTLVAHKDGFRDRTRTINITGLGESYAVTCNFQGNYGLIPNAPTMQYALGCINRWLYPPNPDTGLNMQTALAVINAWLYHVQYAIRSLLNASNVVNTACALCT